MGIPPERTALDPGLGFGKSAEHNRELMRELKQFARFGRPVCLGVSRKGFMGKLLNRPVGERLAGSLAVAAHAAIQGAGVRNNARASRSSAAVRATLSRK